MKSEEEDRIGLATGSEKRGMMTAWWRLSGNLKGREKWDVRPKTTWRRTVEKDAGKRGGPAGQKSGAQYKTGLVGERKLQWRGEN